MDYAAMSLVQLKELAKERKMTGVSGLKKADLIARLKETEPKEKVVRTATVKKPVPRQPGTKMVDSRVKEKTAQKRSVERKPVERNPVDKKMAERNPVDKKNGRPESHPKNCEHDSA